MLWGIITNTRHGTGALLPDETPAPSNLSTPVKVISDVMLCFIPLHQWQWRLTTVTDRLKISSSVMEKRLMLFSSLKHSYLEKQMQSSGKGAKDFGPCTVALTGKKEEQRWKVFHVSRTILYKSLTTSQDGLNWSWIGENKLLERVPACQKWLGRTLVRNPWPTDQDPQTFSSHKSDGQPNPNQQTRWGR